MENKHRSEQKVRKNITKQTIKKLILDYKRRYDGCSPTLRLIIRELNDQTGRNLSTSMMVLYVDEIIKENSWSRDEARRIVTNGEWHDNHTP